MEIANSIEEAQSFFLRNHKDSILCKKDGKEQECNSYPKAVKFFNLRDGGKV